MKTGRKRKSSSPEPRPEHAKVLKRDAVSGYLGTCRLTLSPSKRISTPTKNKSQNSLSPRKHSRFKNHCDKPVYFRHLPCLHLWCSVPFLTLAICSLKDEERGEEQERVRRRSGGKPKKAVVANDNDDCPMADSERPGGDSAPEDDSEEEEFTKLDRDLTIKSRQHNLTSVDVRKIIHEVITNEHVVAMMKAAIKDTQDMPMFEPKMTRSKLKEVVERGVGIPTWNISPIKKSKEIKPPQFLDIPLEDEEDSSDEEYHPDEDEEDETAEETILESDLDSTASSPRISRRGHSRTPVDLSECEEDRNSVTQLSRTSRHLRVEAVPMGPPAPPSQTCGSSRPQRALDSFMEKLHAVDEELELSPLCMEPYQTLSSSENAEESLVACRTRSKRPLRDVPLDQLEAKLRAPDITPDMYDCISALEDREWSQWLQGLMTSQLDNEEEGDDDDDPEYNFLEDLDEPDLEDYRNDRAVRITSEFRWFQDELGMNEHDEEGHEEEEERDEEAASQNIAKFNVPQAIRFEEPLAHMLTACRRTVREQLDALQQRREPQSRMSPITLGPTVVILPSPCSLVLSTSQKRRLQQQIQQHIQLLTQVNMLCSPVEALHSQASTTKLFLVELKLFAERAEQLRVGVVSEFRSVFRVYNLQASLDLLEELEQMPPPPTPSAKRSHPVHPYPLLPAHLAWLFATRSVFLYPELLPHCSLDPALQPPRSKHFYTKGEDGLIVLGLKHFSETEFPYHLMSQHLLQPKKREQLRVRVKDMCSSRAADNVIKFYCQHRVVPALPVACCQVLPGEERPPVEREKNIMPNWLRKSLPHIHKAVFENQSEVRPPYDTRTSPTSPTFIFPEKTQYPPSLPKGLTLLLHPSSRRQNSVQPPKPRPLRGFSCPVLTPLAKASPGPTGIVNVLPKVQAPLSSQRVILLTQVDATPAHGTVPLSSVGPINFQYVVPQLGSVNPAQPPVSLPPDVVQVPPAPAVPSDGLVTTCVMQAPQKKAGVSKKPVMPKKLLPIQPLPLNPAPQLSQLIPLIPGPTVNVNLANTGPAMDQMRTELVCNLPVANYQTTPSLNTLSNGLSIVNVNSRSLLPGNSSTGSAQCAMNPQTPSSLIDSPADDSHCVLVQAALPGGTPQLLVPQNSLIPEQPLLQQVGATSGAPQHQTALTKPETFHRSNMSNMREGALSSRGVGLSSEEEVESGAEMAGEEMAGALFASPLLMLSESSRSSSSSLSSSLTDSTEALDSVLEDSMENLAPAEQRGGWEESRRLAGKDEEKTGSGGEREGNGAYRREDGEGGGERDGPGRRQGNEGRDKNDEEKDGDGEREEEEEDFDELTQDEDEEEVMSSASEESVLSVPELQETMEKLTWLASERRLCGEGDSEEENSPNSPTSPTSPTSPISQNSQEDNSEDEEDGAMKGEELEPTEGEGGKLPEGEAPPEDDPPQTSGKGTGRGRGRGRPPPRSLRRSRRQDRGSKDASKLLLLYDDHILDNDPLRESKDIAFAQAYLNRVREAMLDAPGKMEEFLSLLYEFEQGGENRSAVELFSQLRPLLKDWPELLRDFAAFLLPEQALECGLFEEQQAFERSRRFLRQLEISFGENPSHYQKIVRALQAGSALTPTGVEELKAQMATLLKGHTHLQGEFSLFFDEMRPPLARPGQFEEALWPEDGGGGPEGGDGGMNLASAGGVSAGFEEVALPDLEEEEETQKIAQITGRSRRRKELNTHRNYKDCGWPEKDCLCPCHDCSNDAKHRRHRRKGCPHCHGNKGTDGTKAPKSGDSTFTMSEPLPERGEEREESERGGEDGGEEKETGVKDETGSRASSPHHEDEEEGERDHSSSPSGDKVGLVAEGTDFSPLPQSGGREAAQQIRQSPSSDTHVCAKNISLTPSGERVVLWTRSADRVILTACQQQGANQDTFQDVSAQLGNKTASEVSKRFRDLMRLFHTSARQASSEDEAIEQQSATDEEQD
uniref:GON-4-like protein n=1 Tax=Electrophorus electricus TaxID=8005 RepID=A0A4W4GG39_ELEEL